MSEPTAIEAWYETYDNLVEDCEKDLGYKPELGEFIAWYLEGDVRIGEE